MDGNLQKSSTARAKEYFEALYRRYHRPELLRADPLEIVRAFPDAADREIAALAAALLAYGSVAQIRQSLRRLFERMDGAPAAFVACHTPDQARRALAGFRHRFTDDEDVAALLWLAGRSQKEYGSLEQALLAHDTGDDYAAALEGLLARWGGWSARTPRLRHLGAKPSFKHLTSSPARGSACKRWFLFLRWMVRPADGLDLGLWRRATPAKLLYPVDRHVLRIANNLGVISSKQASLRVARAITAFFREIDPADPVRYDFALCHLGILGACPTAPDVARCNACELAPMCQLRRRLERRASRRRALTFR